MLVSSQWGGPLASRVPVVYSSTFVLLLLRRFFELSIFSLFSFIWDRKPRIPLHVSLLKGCCDGSSDCVSETLSIDPSLAFSPNGMEVPEERPLQSQMEWSPFYLWCCVFPITKDKLCAVWPRLAITALSPDFLDDFCKSTNQISLTHS